MADEMQDITATRWTGTTGIPESFLADLSLNQVRVLQNQYLRIIVCFVPVICLNYIEGKKRCTLAGQGSMA